MRQHGNQFERMTVRIIKIDRNRRHKRKYNQLTGMLYRLAVKILSGDAEFCQFCGSRMQMLHTCRKRKMLALYERRRIVFTNAQHGSSRLSDPVKTTLAPCIMMQKGN